jgi:hypothetical protein
MFVLTIIQRMKTFTIRLKNISPLIFLLGLPVLFLNSCSKSPVTGNIDTPIAGVAFIQASPDEPALDIFFNNSKYDTSPIAYGGTFSYANVNAGTVPIAIYNDATVKAIAADTVQLTQNTAYSLFLTNTVIKPQLFLLTDTLVAPPSGDCSIRFINLSPDAPAADLVIQGGSPVASKVTFKGYTSFLPVKGNTYYTMEVHTTGTSTVLASLSNYKFQAGFVYTVWFHGLAAGTTSTDKLAVDIVANTYFM